MNISQILELIAGIATAVGSISGSIIAIMRANQASKNALVANARIGRHLANVDAHQGLHPPDSVTKEG